VLRSVPFLLSLAALPLAFARRADERVRRWPPPTLGGREMPFAEAVQVGDLLFLSGQLGNVPGTLELVPGGIAAETRQTLANIDAALARCGCNLGDLVKVTVMLADMSEWAAMNEAYVAGFAGHPLPARSSFGTSGLALGARLEMEAVAAAPK